MSGNAQFDASLPSPYSENWREAYRAESGDSPRTASYQPPGGDPVPFIQKNFRFTGGQSRDTAEFPFGGLWSTEYLNEKPQNLTVEGFLRGTDYIAYRNRLVEALRIPTDDANPGYIDLPFWGRFPVLVGDGYEISENADEQGQCTVSIPFTRAGVTIDERTDALSPAGMESASENLTATAVDDFDRKLAENGFDMTTLLAAFGQIKHVLLSFLGRIQGIQTLLNAVTGEITSVMALANQLILSPREIAQAFVNSGAAIAAGVLEIRNSAESYGRINGGTSASWLPALSMPDNAKNVLTMFLSAGSFTLPIETATVGQEAAKKASENIYRTTAFLASASVLADMEGLTQKKAQGYWRMMEKLEAGIDRENPAVHAAVAEMRTALSGRLSARGLDTEKTQVFSVPLPLLQAAHRLGCGESRLRELNTVPDSFTVSGEVVYV